MQLTDDEKMLGYKIINFENEYEGYNIVINEKGFEVRSEKYTP